MSQVIEQKEQPISTDKKGFAVLDSLPDTLSISKQSFLELWGAGADLLTVIHKQPYGAVKYQGKIFQDSATYQVAIEALQEAEKLLFGEPYSEAKPKRLYPKARRSAKRRKSD